MYDIMRNHLFSGFIINEKLEEVILLSWNLLIFMTIALNSEAFVMISLMFVV